MSVIFRADVMCDACGNWIETGVSGTGGKGQNLASRAAKVAKSKGWSRSTRSVYTDLCPDCLVKSRRVELPEGA